MLKREQQRLRDTFVRDLAPENDQRSPEDHRGCRNTFPKPIASNRKSGLGRQRSPAVVEEVVEQREYSDANPYHLHSLSRRIRL